MWFFCFWIAVPLLCTVRHVFRNEQRYYELLLEKSKSSLCLFPYHLADIVTKGLRVTPFNYYIDVLCLLLKNDKSYDTLPNFTAADCKWVGNSVVEQLRFLEHSSSEHRKLWVLTGDEWFSNVTKWTKELPAVLKIFCFVKSEWTPSWISVYVIWILFLLIEFH